MTSDTVRRKPLSLLICLQQIRSWQNTPNTPCKKHRHQTGKDNAVTYSTVEYTLDHPDAAGIGAMKLFLLRMGWSLGFCKWSEKRRAGSLFLVLLSSFKCLLGSDSFVRKVVTSGLTSILTSEEIYQLAGKSLIKMELFVGQSSNCLFCPLPRYFALVDRLITPINYLCTP